MFQISYRMVYFLAWRTVTL